MNRNNGREIGARLVLRSAKAMGGTQSFIKKVADIRKNNGNTPKKMLPLFLFAP